MATASLHRHSPFRQHKTKDKHEIDRMTLTMNVELPDSFSAELKSLLEGLLQRDVAKRLGCLGRGGVTLQSGSMGFFAIGLEWIFWADRLSSPVQSLDSWPEGRSESLDLIRLSLGFSSRPLSLGGFTVSHDALHK
ncbi:hypothetical protein JZ751_011672 [Albula glossodonta]|uniref:Uncharacterized protein n=1 Tax=Albula glossodonta TaxID=121402 RepID=A0A8T2PQC9_9TELE|nr:hypothetical protein JZ751_011672 [Albula glossodonta]